MKEVCVGKRSARRLSGWSRLLVAYRSGVRINHRTAYIHSTAPPGQATAYPLHLTLPGRALTLAASTAAVINGHQRNCRRRHRHYRDV